jgi:uncharacterized protein YbbC (DUF1343 family)
MKPDFATGLEVLLSQRLDILKGRRVGLVSHPAAVTRQLVDNVQALLAAGINLTALFGPEHGFTASAGEGVLLDDARDPRTGLPVYSLYGAVQEPTPEALQQVDVLVYDLQDVGVRFYTYVSTLYNLVRAAGRNNFPLVVLDRPNPISGSRMDGPLLEPGYESFVGLVPIPVCHGMTLGELALFMNGEFGFFADLIVVPMQGWQRSWWFDQTERLWVPTSPAMPRLETAIIYPGTCFLEGTNLSEGRGTSLPFEVVGAPWLEGYLLAQRLNLLNLSGVFFRPTSFTPSTSKHQGQVCHGVQVHVLDRETFSPLQAALEIISTCQDLAPGTFAYLPPFHGEDGPNHFDLLAGTPKLRRDLESGTTVKEIMAGWHPGLDNFSTRRHPYLHYD